VNAPGYNIWGVLAEATGGFGRDDAFFANYTFQRSTDRATSSPVADIPSQLLNMGATFNLHERYSVTPTLLVRGSRPRGPGDPRPPVAGYALVGLTARARQVYHSLEVVLSVQNLFNHYYVDPSPLGGVPGDYPRPGRSIWLHAAFRF
jgi:outer membrane receptor for ferric coprogen and ferric-rhodotorulic acid